MTDGPSRTNPFTRETDLLSIGTNDAMDAMLEETVYQKAQTMQWLEIIRLRMGGTETSSIDAGELERLTRDMTAPDLVEARVFRSASIPNDLLVLLSWSRPVPDPWGSDLGHRLVAAFKRYGLVDHTAWTGMNGTTD